MSELTEQEDIEAVCQYIHHQQPNTLDEIIQASPGPTTDQELSQYNLSRQEQVKRIVNGLEEANRIQW